VRNDHRESPTKRINPSGKVVWVARYTGPDGRRRSAGTFSLKRQAQDAIDRAYETPTTAQTVGDYLERWVPRYPRSERTNRTNVHRIRRVLAVKIEGLELRDWLLRDLRRRHVNELVDHMLSAQRRAPTGAIDILRALSAMCEDAITDELCDVPVQGRSREGIRSAGAQAVALTARVVMGPNACVRSGCQHVGANDPHSGGLRSAHRRVVSA
jgi:hypothetical protein